MNVDYVVVWNGAKDGPNRGHLAIDADMPAPAPAPIQRYAGRPTIPVRILGCLAVVGACTVPELCTRMGHTSGALHRPLETMLTQGLVVVCGSRPSTRGRGRPALLYRLSAHGLREARRDGR